MKVLIGGFSTESNAYIAVKNNITDYNISFGEDFLHHFALADIFEDEGIELIPAIEAKSGPSGVIEKDAFDYIEGQMLKAVKNHLHEIDGIYLMFHGTPDCGALSAHRHYLRSPRQSQQGVRGGLRDHHPYLPPLSSYRPGTEQQVCCQDALRSCEKPPKYPFRIPKASHDVRG